MKFAEKALYLCTNYPMDHKGLAKVFDVSVETIRAWMIDHEEFSVAVKKGKDAWNTHTVEDSLLKRAMGYKYIETTREPLYNSITGKALKDPKTGKAIIAVTKKVTKSVAPDTTAIIFYLKNRDPGRWREKSTHELVGKDGEPLPTGGLVLIPTKLSEEEWKKQVEAYLESQAGSPSPSKG